MKRRAIEKFRHEALTLCQATRVFVLLSSALLLMHTSGFAQEEASRLRYTTPKHWTLDSDGETLLPAGNRDDAVVVFSPSRAFAGTAEQWATEKWNRMARDQKIVSGPRLGTQGTFLTRTGVFEKPDGTRFWVVLNTLVQDGRGEAVIFLATNETQFRTHLPALSEMLNDASVAVSSADQNSSEGTASTSPASTASDARAPAAPSTPVSASPPASSAPSVHRGAPVPGAAEVAGFYRLTKRVYDAAPYGTPGSGQWNYRKLYYLLSSDGQVFRGTNSPELPDGDIESFDFDAARRRSPKDAGTYQVKGDEVILTMGEAPQQAVVATRSRDRLKLNDPAFTYGEFSFFRSVRALPEPARAPAMPPEVVRVPAASIPAAIEGLPTLVYQAPPGFRDPSGSGHHESIATGQVRVEVYDFRRFLGKNFEQEFRATRFREWLAASSREEADRIVGEPVFEPQTMENAEQVFSATFQDGSEALREIVDTNAPRVRSRFAILASGAVAFVDLIIRDGEALQNQQAGLNAFSESLKIQPVPPPMTREDILAIAGVWEWDGWSGYGKEALPHEEQAQIESYVFSVDGRVVWDHGRPDFRNFDFARAAVAESTTGTYFKRGDQFVLRFGAPPYYVYSATIKGRDTLEILGYTYHRKQRVEAK